MRPSPLLLALAACTTRLPPAAPDGSGLREDPPLVGEWMADDLAVFSNPPPAPGALGEYHATAMGDFTGDGIDDLVVGDPTLGHPSWGRHGKGLVTVYDSAAGFAPIADWTGSGDYEAIGYSGEVLAADLNDDGIDDLVLAGDWVYVFYGPLAETGGTVDDADVFVDLGAVAMAAADLTGDGRTDLVLSDGASDRTLVFEDLPATGVRVRDDATFAIQAAGAIATGDLDGDGQADLARRSSTWEVLTEYGPLGSRAPTSHTFGPWWTDEVQAEGASLAVVPDVTGDGVDDIVVGYPNYDHNGNETGEVFVWDGVQEYVIMGSFEDEHVGVRIAGAGDVDGDGFGDLLFGSRATWESGLGHTPTTTLIYGPLLPEEHTRALENPFARITGASSPSASGGDFDGDGTPDLWLGDGGVYAIPGQARPETPSSVDDLLPGDLVVTEIMANPATCSDANGEWIEIYVAAEVPVDLDGLTLRDEAQTLGTVAGPLLVQPGAYVVLAAGTAESWCGPQADGFYGATPKWNNGGGDAVTLLDRTGRPIDLAPRYPTALAASGTSARLDDDAPDAETNDDPARWGRSTTPFGSEYGTPGAPNLP